MYDYFDIYMNYGEEKNTIFAHPEYAVQNQLTIKTNTFSESLYFVLFHYLMTKWWKCSINTGWSRKVNMFLLEFCFVTPCIILVPPWIWDQTVHNEYLHFLDRDTLSRKRQFSR